MFRSNDEPTLDEIMRDPTVRALMAADRVDIARFEAKLRRLAGSFRRERPDSPRPDAAASKGLLPLVTAGFDRPDGAARHCWC